MEENNTNYAFKSPFKKITKPPGWIGSGLVGHPNEAISQGIFPLKAGAQNNPKYTPTCLFGKISFFFDYRRYKKKLKKRFFRLRGQKGGIYCPLFGRLGG